MYSHKFTRNFQAKKIKAPRDFVQPAQDDLHNAFLEIGAGKGMHALQFAQANPNIKLFAVERTKEKFTAFAKQLQQEEGAGLNNLTAVHADAIAWSVHALQKSSLAGAFILYPNPESNNANQRWLNMPFFEFLLSRLQENTQIILATNIESYALEAFEQAKDVWMLPCSLSEIPVTSSRTHFEKKYLERGEKCWQLTMTKPVGYTTSFDDF